MNSTLTGPTLRELPWVYSERLAVGGSRKITLQLVMTARALRAEQPSSAKRKVQPAHRSMTAKELQAHTGLSFCGCRLCPSDIQDLAGNILEIRKAGGDT